MSPQNRQTDVKNASLCSNCLRAGHRVADCRLNNCRKCNKRHNTLLHFDKSSDQTEQLTAVENAAASSGTASYHIRLPSQIYLATAIVDVVDSQGNYQPCRVMIDGGSQSCAITDSCASRLGLRKRSFKIPLLSIDDMCTKIQFRTFATIKSRFNNECCDLELLIVKQISNSMPSCSLDRDAFKIPQNIFLADPDFHVPAPIDIIIGAEYAYSFLLAGQLSLKGHTAVLQKTSLGWIIAGRVYDPQRRNKVGPKSVVCNFLHNTCLPLLWELDKVQPSSTRSKEEQACENHFVEHVQRDNTGRYTVKLPFNNKIEKLGESKKIKKK